MGRETEPEILTWRDRERGKDRRDKDKDMDSR